MKVKDALVLFSSTLLLSCSNITYTDFDQYQYEPAIINDKEEIEILTFSGGKECTNEISYYYSVIAIVSHTNDTVRILTPCQLLSQDFPIGVFRKPSALRDSVLSFLGIIANERYVAINPKLPLQNRNYPVAIGSISFDDIDDKQILKEDMKNRDIDTSLLDASQKPLN